MEAFTFYVLTELTRDGYQLAGYFSKVSPVELIYSSVHSIFFFFFISFFLLKLL